MIHFNVHTCQHRLPDACFLRDHCSEKQVLATTPMRINRISNICFVSRKHFRACLFFLRKHFRCSFGISFDIALLRTVHCFRTCSVATGRSKSLLELAFWPLGARNHCSSLLFVAPERHWALEITARACFFFLRGHWAREITARTCFEATERSKALLEHAFVSFGSTVEHASFSFENTFDHACFLLRNPFRNRSASNCALLRAVLCATSQAP